MLNHCSLRAPATRDDPGEGSEQEPLAAVHVPTYGSSLREQWWDKGEGPGERTSKAFLCGQYYCTGASPGTCYRKRQVRPRRTSGLNSKWAPLVQTPARETGHQPPLAAPNAQLFLQVGSRTKRLTLSCGMWEAIQLQILERKSTNSPNVSICRTVAKAGCSVHWREEHVLPRSDVSLS